MSMQLLGVASFPSLPHHHRHPPIKPNKTHPKGDTLETSARLRQGESLINGCTTTGGHQDWNTHHWVCGRRRRAPPTHPMRESESVSGNRAALLLVRKSFPACVGLSPTARKFRCSVTRFPRARGVEPWLVSLSMMQWYASSIQVGVSLSVTLF